jgi:nucleoside-diphosphate-sugar epimerase
MKILVTGVAGFIGMHSAKKLLDDGHEIIGIDNLNDYYDVSLKEDRLKALESYKNFRFLKLDIKDQKDVLNLFKKESPQRVLHLAARARARGLLPPPACARAAGEFTHDGFRRHAQHPHAERPPRPELSHELHFLQRPAQGLLR